MWARFHVNSQVKERTLTLQHAHAHTCTCACIFCEQERRVHIHTCKHTPAFVLHWILFDTGREKHCQSVVKLSAQQLFSTWLLTLHMKPLTHMHTANLVWSVLPLTVSHRSSCRAERKFVLQVYSGRRYFVFRLCSCLHCSGVCHCGLFAHDKGARMLKKHLYPLLSIVLYGSTWLSYMTEECIVCVWGDAESVTEPVFAHKDNSSSWSSCCVQGPVTWSRIRGSICDTHSCTNSEPIVKDKKCDAS